MLKTPGFWLDRGWQAQSLRPLAALYQAGSALHSFVKSAKTSAVPLICVGNLTAGGSGKTPLVRAIVRGLRARGFRTLILSKGYGGGLAGPILVDPAVHGAADCGDEPLMLAHDAPVLISKSRSQSLDWIASNADDFDIVVMDDGLQNPSLNRYASVAVVDAGFGFGNGLTLPAGPMREPLGRGLKRVQAVAIMQTSDEPPHASTRSLQTSLPVLQFHLETQVPVSEQRFFAFCGIGRPQKFYHALHSAGAKLSGTKSFGDHQPYSAEIMSKLILEAKNRDAQLLTTEKDWMRVPANYQQRCMVASLLLKGPIDSLINRLLA